MPARMRFSILETSGRVHAKVYDKRGRSSEREGLSLEAQDVQGPQALERVSETAASVRGVENRCPARRVPAAKLRDWELYIMQDERCEA
jgi:hypothetical protein